MSTKRSNSEFLNKDEFPFNIINGIINFPKLYSKTNTTENIRFWQIYGSLVSSSNNKINITNTLIDINKFKEYNKKNNNLKLYIYAEYGITNGKLTKTEPTIITTGKNIGKSNETSIITQSLIHMRTLFLKKVKTGYMTDINKTSNTNNIYPYIP